jgi:precorrin-2 methylase
MPMGRLHGLDIGPGALELLTLKAWRLLQAALIVAYRCRIRGPILLWGVYVSLHAPGRALCYRSVPGVSSVMARASALETPLTYRNDVFVVLPALLPAA